MKAFVAEEQIDAGLVTRCQKELPYESEAFECLVMRYQDRVYGKALTMIRNRDEAADLTQDVFVKVFHALPSFRQDASFSTWLYTITANTCLNHLEKMQRRPWWGMAVNTDEVCVDAQQSEELFSMAGQTVEQTELGEMIEQTMDMVSDTSRETICLRYFEGLDYQSMANRLGISLSALKMRLKRARAEFMRIFESLSGEGEAIRLRDGFITT